MRGDAPQVCKRGAYLSTANLPFIETFYKRQLKI